MPKSTFTRAGAALIIAAAVLLGAAMRRPHYAQTAAGANDSSAVAASRWLARLPDGETKRRFILDCTGCHQFTGRIVRPDGRERTREEWETAIARMLTYAGATTGFPVISAAREPAPTAEWLSRALAIVPVRDLPDESVPRTPGAILTEYPMPEARDLPHDVAVDSGPAGEILITGMFTHRIYRLDPSTGKLAETPIPVERANPRAIELDGRGNWWVVLGAPNRLAKYDPRTAEWTTVPVGVYPHSVAVGGDGSAWFNGHFTRDPELVGRVGQAGDTTLYRIPTHPTLGSAAGGPIPYEIRVAPDGRLWGSELGGNRLFVVDPATRAVRTYDMPEPHSGPRRFDIDARGTLWIPAYAGNALWELDPLGGRFTKHALPVVDALPYVARVDDGANAVWVGTGAADAVLRFDRGTKQWTSVPLSRGAMVRHLAIDRKTHDVWVASGASPGELTARVARIRTAATAR